MTDIDIDRVVALTERIKPILAGEDPAHQNAALADLLALFIAGHRPDLREPVLAAMIGLVRELVPLNAQLYGINDAWREMWARPLEETNPEFKQ